MVWVNWRNVVRTSVVALGVVACVGVDVSITRSGWKITFTGEDGKIITAKGLEQAKDQINEHLWHLQNQEPANEAWISDWSTKYDGVLDKKKEFGEHVSGSGEDAEPTSAAPAPL